MHCKLKEGQKKKNTVPFGSLAIGQITFQVRIEQARREWNLAAKRRLATVFRGQVPRSQETLYGNDGNNVHSPRYTTHHNRRELLRRGS